MKIFQLALTLSLLAVVLAASELISSKAEASLDPSMSMQQSYELRCRGGGSMKFNSTPGSTSSSGEQMTNVTIDFAVGTQGAGTGKPNLNPGQCSWIDRGFRPGEPPQIHLEIVSFGQQAEARHGSPVDRSHRCRALSRCAESTAVPVELRSLLDLLGLQHGTTLSPVDESSRVQGFEGASWRWQISLARQARKCK